MKQDQITAIIQELSGTNKERLNEVYALLYSDIKAIAGKQISRLHTGETITPTVLAHECYLKIFAAQNVQLENSKHFLNCLAKSMRSFLIDQLRAKQSKKRSHQAVALTEFLDQEDVPLHLLDFDHALSQIEQIDERLAHILENKLLFNLTFAEQSKIFALSERQIMRLWKQAKAMLVAMLKEDKHE